MKMTYKHVFQGSFGQPTVEEDGDEQVAQWRVAHLYKWHTHAKMIT